MANRILRTTLLATLVSPFLLAQSDVARIVGTVTDKTGAVIPGATISVKNERTGQTRKVMSNEAGSYSIMQLQPAVYTLMAETPGMSPAEFKAINLSVGQERV